MPSSLPPGTFRLHPYAEPPLAAGRYTLTGDVTGLPGPVQQMASRVDVVSPRLTLPPDQILGTFPPAGARGSFTSRLPQIVIRRRTLPWERSTDLDAATAPTPWLALVLVAEGEGQLLTDVNVADCVTPGVTLTGDADVPKSACLEIPEEVVAKTFPTAGDLHLLSHVRAVDMADTELAMGDDDGFLAVVMGNRLPQPGVRYLACLISVEGQVPKLPVIPDNQLDVKYQRDMVVLDLAAEANVAYGDVVAYDTAAMKLPGSGLGEVTSRDAAAPGPAPAGKLLVSGAAGPAAKVAQDWAAGPAPRPASAAHVEMDGGGRVSAAAIGQGVVGHDRLDGAGALFGHPGGGALQDGGGDVAAVVAVDLDVGQAAVVIDDDVGELDALRPCPAQLLGAIAVCPVPRRIEARQLLGVHVQEGAGL